MPTEPSSTVRRRWHDAVAALPNRTTPSRARLGRDVSRFVFHQPSSSSSSSSSSDISTSSSSSSSSDDEATKLKTLPTDFAQLEPAAISSKSPATTSSRHQATQRSAASTKRRLKKYADDDDEERFLSLPKFRSFMQTLPAGYVGGICAGLFFLVLPYSLVSTVGQQMLITNSSITTGNERLEPSFTNLGFFHVFIPLCSACQLFLIFICFVYFFILWRITGENRRVKRRVKRKISAANSDASEHHVHGSSMQADQIAPEHFHPRLNMLLGVAALLFHVSLLAHQTQKLGHCPEPVVFDFVLISIQLLWVLATIFLPYWIIRCGFRHADLHLHLIGLTALLCLNLVRLADSLSSETVQELLFWRELDHLRHSRHDITSERIDESIWAEERRKESLRELYHANHAEKQNQSRGERGAATACQYELTRGFNTSTEDDDVYQWRGTNQSLKPLFPFTAEFFLLQTLTCVIWILQLLSRFIHGVFETETNTTAETSTTSAAEESEKKLMPPPATAAISHTDESSIAANASFADVNMPHVQASQKQLMPRERRRAKAWLLLSHVEIEQQLAEYDDDETRRRRHAADAEIAEIPAFEFQSADAAAVPNNGLEPHHHHHHHHHRHTNHRMLHFLQNHILWCWFLLFVICAVALFLVILLLQDGMLITALGHWELQRYLDFYCHCRTRRVIVFALELSFAVLGIALSGYILVKIRRVAEFYPLSAWQQCVTFGRKLHLLSDIIGISTALFGELALRAFMVLIYFTELTLDAQRRDQHEEQDESEFLRVCRIYAPCGSFAKANFKTVGLIEAGQSAVNNVRRGEWKATSHDLAAFLFGQFSILDAGLAVVQSINVILQTATWMTVVLSVIVLQVPAPAVSNDKSDAARSNVIVSTASRHRSQRHSSSRRRSATSSSWRRPASTKKEKSLSVENARRVLKQKPAHWAMSALAYLSLLNAVVRVIVAFFLPYDTSIANSTAARIFGRAGWTMLRQTLFPFIMFFGTHFFVLMDEESHEFYERLCCKAASTHQHHTNNNNSNSSKKIGNGQTSGPANGSLKRHRSNASRASSHGKRNGHVQLAVDSSSRGADHGQVVWSTEMNGS